MHGAHVEHMERNEWERSDGDGDEILNVHVLVSLTAPQTFHSENKLFQFLSSLFAKNDIITTSR